MLTHRLPDPFVWPAAELPLETVERDWSGVLLAPPPRFALVLDPERLWLVAERHAPAAPHPDAVPGAFVPGLWEWDVAELFLGHVSTPAYLELNLAPTGAWWSCVFDEPRVPRRAGDAPLADVQTHATTGTTGWRAALGAPLDALRAVVPLDQGLRANVTFVLCAPARHLASAAPPQPGGEPDFHAPTLRRPVRIAPARRPRDGAGLYEPAPRGSHGRSHSRRRS